MNYNKVMLSKKNSFLILLGVLLMVSSCSTPKNITYFQNKVIDEPQKIDKHAGIVIQPNDKLSIVVSGRNPELVAMFNLPHVGYQVGAEEAQASGNGLLGYVVDNKGFIEFPVLGMLQVEGLTRWELAEKIRKRLVDDGLLSDALVTVDFMNFKVSVLGEVKAPGIYNLGDDNPTILQALSSAGDLTIYGVRENVTLIRELNGARTFYQINLCDVSMFNSPAYYLQQNDVIYVEPNPEKSRESTDDQKSTRIASILVSGGSILVSLASLLVNLLL